MSGFVDDLFSSVDLTAGQRGAGFEPTAKYYHAMDFLLYVREDCAYVADRVDPYLTVLYHPNEGRIVGIKLKGFRFLFDQFRKIVGRLGDEHFLPVVKFIEIALVAGVAEAYIAENKERIQKSYAEARQLVENVEFDPSEFRMAA